MKNRIFNYGDILFILVFALLVIVWPLPHSIAIRNFSLATSLFLSCHLFLKYDLLKYTSIALASFFFLFFAWLVVHYFYFSHNPFQELEELKSTSLRAFVGCLVAFLGARFLRIKHPNLHWLLLGVHIYLCIVIFLYLDQSYSLDEWLSPKLFLEKINSNNGINKLNAAFLGSIAVAIGYANIYTMLFLKVDWVNEKTKFSLHILGITTGFLAPYLLNSKNGISVNLILSSIFVAHLFLALIKNTKNPKKILIPLTFIVAISFLFGGLHAFSASPGWGTIIHDILIAIQVDKYSNWQNIGLFGLPLNEFGISVTHNTYERFAWATKGLQLLLDFPFGYGTLTEQSFPALLKYQGVNLRCLMVQCGTHSGWVDFGLAYGFPGMIIFLFTILIGLIKSFRNNSLNFVIARWLFLLSLLAPIVQEIAMKHTFELWVFIIAFAVGLISDSRCLTKSNYQGTTQ